MALQNISPDISIIKQDSKNIVTVFGSSIPKEGDQEYDIAYRLGKELAKNNFAVCTGGYQGIMNAVSKGALENGSKAIGITVENLNDIPSKYLTTEIKCKTLQDRISNLVALGDAFIILNGGTGTLLELATIWELTNKNLLSPKPIVCLGEMWKAMIYVVEQRIRIEKRTMGLVKYSRTIEECIKYLKENIKSN